MLAAGSPVPSASRRTISGRGTFCPASSCASARSARLCSSVMRLIGRAARDGRDARNFLSAARRTPHVRLRSGSTQKLIGNPAAPHRQTVLGETPHSAAAARRGSTASSSAPFVAATSSGALRLRSRSTPQRPQISARPGKTAMPFESGLNRVMRWKMYS